MKIYFDSNYLKIEQGRQLINRLQEGEEKVV